MSGGLRSAEETEESQSEIKSEIQEEPEFHIELKNMADIQEERCGINCIDTSVTNDIKCKEMMENKNRSEMFHSEKDKNCFNACENFKDEHSKISMEIDIDRVSRKNNQYPGVWRSDIINPTKHDGLISPRNEPETEKITPTKESDIDMKELKPNCNKNPFISGKTAIDSQVKSHKTKKNYNCPHCIFGCYRKRDFESHLWLHTGKECKVCPMCGYRCVDKSTMKEHQKTHTGYRSHQCPYCPHKSTTKFSLKVHVKTHQCSRCPFSASSSTDVKRHVAENHPAEEPEPKESFSCKVCNKAFSTKYYLADHAKSHTGELLKCEYCPYATPHKFILETHKIQHAVREDLGCSVCSKKYKNRAGLEKHFAQKHLGIAPVKPFKCSFSACAYAAVSRSILAAHENLHNDEWPYRCSECESKYRYKRSLELHKEKLRHACHLCSFTACAIRTLAAHIKNHVEETPLVPSDAGETQN